jgi:hypothetical protein
MKHLLVYNADSGLASALFDSAHKLLSPRTYECNLCALTHSLLGPKQEWSAFLQTLPEKPEFLHRDEFMKQYPACAHTLLPAIFQISNEGLVLLADGPRLASLKDLDELMALLER